MRWGWGLGTLIIAACAAPLEQPTRSVELFWAPGEGDAARRFEQARRSTPELIAFLRRFPKGADLHNHIGGATYADYLIDSAHANGKRFNRTTLTFTDEEGPDTITMDEFLNDYALIAEFRNVISMRGWYPNTTSGHDHFFQTFARVESAGRSAGEILAEIMARNAYQNVQYLELMATTAPVEVIARFQAAFRGLDVDNLEASFAPLAPLTTDPEVRAAFTRELDRWETEALTLLETQHGVAPEQAPMVRYIPQLNRVGSLDLFFGAAVLFMTAVAADERIVAVNMVAPEDLPSARRQFDAQMRILDFLWHRLGRPNMTLHGGELSLRESPVEPMWDRIRRTIDEGHAKRIGHGTSVAWERDFVGLLDRMRREPILVEISLSSSEAILGIAGDDHPFQMYRAAGVPLCICTDDEAVSRSNLTMEYVTAADRYDLGYVDVKALARSCLEHAFLPDELKAVQLAEFDARVADFERSLATGFRE
jgi:adenosine deaminase